jgi:hypothetical protein
MRWVSCAPARGRLIDRLHDRSELLVAAEHVGQELGHPDDDREDVVEVVRDAAGELADRLHLLRLAQLALERDPLGHVAADEEILAVRLGPHAGPGERHRLAVLWT